MKKIYLHVTSGLANRLIAITSWMRIAEKYERELVLSWPMTSFVSAKWNELFEPHFQMAEWSEIDVSPDARFSNPDDRLWTLNLDNIDTDVAVSGGVFAHHPGDDLSGESRSYITELADYFDRLKPNSEVLERVDSVAAGRDWSRILGVHIRAGYGDTMAAQADFQRWRVADYAAVIDALFHPLGRNDVFLSTDSLEVGQEFSRYYNTFRQNIRSLERDKDRASIQDALADILLLSKCKSIVKPQQTTFSHFAAIIGRRPLVTIFPPRRHGTMRNEIESAVTIPAVCEGRLFYQNYWFVTHRGGDARPNYILDDQPLAVEAVNFSYAEGVTYGDPGTPQNLLRRHDRARTVFVEYSFYAIQPGRWQPSISYAASVSRPCELLVDGKVTLSPCCEKVTGGWDEDSVITDKLSPVLFKPGPNSLRLRPIGGAIPHLRSITLTPLPND